MHIFVYLSFIFTFLLIPKVFLYAQSRSVSDIAESAIPSVVQIVVYDITGTQRGQGSGFFIAPGEILTNAHVVEGAYSAEIFSDTEYYNQVTVLKSLEDVDLALLSVDDRTEITLKLEKERKIRPGECVITIGNPMGLEKTISDGLVSAIRGIPGESQVIQISAPISPGSSGGPLLSQQGCVIGVISATLSEGQNLNFAIGIETIREFFKKPNDPHQLHKARARVLWRAILKWIVNIFLGLIALAFGGGWWIIFIIIMICSGLVWLLKRLHNLIMMPFRKRRTNTAGKYLYDTKSSFCEEPPYNPEREETNLFTDIENNEQTDSDLFKFHCWKCGTEVYVDFSDRPDSIKCDECGTKLPVPKE